MPNKTAVKKTTKRSAKKTPERRATKAKTSLHSKGACAGKCTTASSDKYFWVNNGPVCCDLAELRQALKSMTDEQFAYHTQRAGNDFARWIDEVLRHHTCAQKLTKARTRSGAARALATCKCC